MRADPTAFTKLNIETVVGHYDRNIANSTHRRSSSDIRSADCSLNYSRIVDSALRQSDSIPALPPGAVAAVLDTARRRTGTCESKSTEESQVFYDRYAVPCVDRVFFEGAVENFALHSPARVDVAANRPPILLIAGGKDRSVRGSRRSRSSRDVRISPELSRGLEELADYALEWALNPVASSAEYSHAS